VFKKHKFNYKQDVFVKHKMPPAAAIFMCDLFLVEFPSHRIFTVSSFVNYQGKVKPDNICTVIEL